MASDDGWEDIPQDGWEDAPEDGWEDVAEEKPAAGSSLGQWAKALLSGDAESLPELNAMQNKGDDFARGGFKGLSMAHSDELGGASDAPLGAAKEIANKFGANFNDEDVNAYKSSRDNSRAMDAQAQERSPKTFLGGEVSGALAASLIPGLNAGKGAGLIETSLRSGAQGLMTGAGASNAESIGQIAKDAATGTGYGILGGAAGYGLGKGIEKGASLFGRGAQGAANALNETAENLALKSTGATGREAQKFAPNAGRELLDRGLVQFGDDAERIAERIGDANDAAGSAIQSALKKLDAQGVTASQDNVIRKLEEQILELSQDPSQAGVVKQLRGTIDEIIATGESNIPISHAEKIKRGYNNKSKLNWADPEKSQAGKNAYLGYMDEVERAALEADPSLAGQFMEGKKTYGLLKPIQDAANRRASTLNQSPLGGLLDTAAAGFGEVAKGGAGIPVALARRGIMPRVASMGAVTADSLAKIAAQAPEMLGKFSGPIQNAAKRGTQALAATHFILESSNPEYREMMKKMQGFEGE